jgi:hypothetical protein
MSSTTRKHVALGYEADEAASAISSSASAASGARRLRFDTVARFAAPEDNCAVVTQTLESGTVLEMPDGSALRLDCTVLEGHRFAARPIPSGDLLLSWGCGFGKALVDISAGELTAWQQSLTFFARLVLAANLSDRKLPPSHLPQPFTQGLMFSTRR